METPINDLIPTSEHETRRALRIINRETKKLKRDFSGNELNNHLILMRYSILTQLKREKDRKQERLKELEKKGIEFFKPISRREQDRKE